MSLRCPAPAFEGKICAMEDLAARAAALPHPVVFTNGVFDILHRGHVTYLAQARALGADVGLGALLLVPRGPRRGAHLALGNLPLVAAEPDEPVGGGFLAGEGDKRADIAHVPVRDGLDVVADVLRV